MEDKNIVDMKKAQFTMEMTAKVMKAVMNSDNYVLDLLKQLRMSEKIS